MKEKALPATPKPRISLDFDFSTGIADQLDFDLGSSLGVPSELMTAINEEEERASLPPSLSTPKPSGIPRLAPLARQLSGKEAIKAHEAAIIARRRAIRRRENGEDTEPEDEERARLTVIDERPRRRRSRSTGDVMDAHTEVGI
jgi:hypothetical protein